MTGDGVAPASARRPRRLLDAIVLVDKPHGITSNAALQRVKRAFNADKAGHTGTLDPLATGLLPICFGEATKFSSGLLDADKGYRATIELGATTDTGDREGEVIARGVVPTDLATIEHALMAFRGHILQRPHRYSAIKRDGRALYSYAREGIDVDIAPRAVRIIELNVEDWQPPMLSIDVICSKGTYIRSLAEDIGARLGCGGHVAELRRTRVGHLTLGDAVSLDRIEAEPPETRDAWLQPLIRLVEQLRTIELDRDAAAAFLHGQRIMLPLVAAGGAPTGTSCEAAIGDASSASAERPIAVRVAGSSGDPGFLGLATITQDGDRSFVVPARVVASRSDRSVASAGCPAHDAAAASNACPDR